jgi:hypothetical protein
MRSTLLLPALALWTLAPARAQTVPPLDAHNVTVSDARYQGKQAVRLLSASDAANGSSYAIVKGVTFADGAIEVDLAGKPSANAGPAARGFIGIAFRLGQGKYEYIYLRPTNGRADDQVRRNHSTQYSSHPDFDYARLRQESPEKYESYVDLEAGAWTHYKIEVEGAKARLFVHNSAQPCLIVNDLKLDARQGGVALWVGPATEGYFANLKITPKASARLYFDQAHGEAPPPAAMADIGQRLGYTLDLVRGPATPESLGGSRLVYFRAPNGTFAESEKAAIVAYVKGGGSLLLVLDEEKRQSLSKTGVNDILAPFGMKLSGDTPRIANIGAIAKAGEINRADREVPYDGGREIFGGTPFAFQLDRRGNPAQPYAAYRKLDNGARIVVMAEGMASLFLGSPNAVRLYEDPVNPDGTLWWGKDSRIFMEEVLAWLLAR